MEEAFNRILTDILKVVSNKSLESGGDRGAVGPAQTITLAPTTDTNSKVPSFFFEINSR